MLSHYLIISFVLSLVSPVLSLGAGMACSHFASHIGLDINCPSTEDVQTMPVDDWTPCSAMIIDKSARPQSWGLLIQVQMYSFHTDTGPSVFEAS